MMTNTQARRLRLLGVFLLVSMAAGIFMGCGKNFEKMSAREIYEYGEKRFAKKRYTTALDAYEALIDLYPFSMYAVKAEIRLADTQYKKRQWAEAVASYETFLERHPTHEKIPHVLHRLGMANYRQKLSIDRDQQATVESMNYFSRLMREYPDSKAAEESKEYFQKVKNDLAERQRYVAKFYWRSDEYYAALERFLNVARLYPDSKYYQESLYYAGLCYKRLDEPKSAYRQLRLLMEKFPEGKYYKRAKKTIEELQYERP